MTSPTTTIRRNSGNRSGATVATNNKIDWSGYLGAGTTTFRAAASPTRRPPKKIKTIVRNDNKQKQQAASTTKKHVSSSMTTSSISPNLIIQKNPLKRHNSTGSVCGPALTTVSSTSTLLSKVSLVDDSEWFTPSSPRSNKPAVPGTNQLLMVPHDYEYHENHAKLHEAYNNTYNNMDIPYYNYYDCTTTPSSMRHSSSNSNGTSSPHDNRQVQVQVQVQQQEEKKRRNSDNERLVLLHQDHVATNKCKIVQVVETHNDQQLHDSKRHSTSSNTLNNTTSNSSTSSSSSSSSRNGSNTTTSKREIKTITAEKVKQHIPYTSSSSNNNNNNNNINDADQSHASTTAPSTTPQSSCSSSSISSPSSSFSFVSYVKDKFLTKQQYKSKVNHLQKYRMIQTKQKQKNEQIKSRQH